MLVFNRGLMIDPEAVEDELVIDWEHLFGNLPDDLEFDFSDRPTGDGLSRSHDTSCSLSVGDIEQYLMNDECNHPEVEDILADGFLSDVLLDSSAGSESDPDRAKDSSVSHESVEVETEEEEKEQDKDQNGVNVPPRKDDSAVDEVDDNDDPDAKKRKRY